MLCEERDRVCLRARGRRKWRRGSLAPCSSHPHRSASYRHACCPDRLSRAPHRRLGLPRRPCVASFPSLSPSLVIIPLTPTSLVQTSSPSSSSAASVSGALCAARTRATTSRSSSQRTASTPISRSPSSRTSRRCVPPPVPPRRDVRADSCPPVRSLMLSTRPSRASTPSCTPVRPSPPLLLARTRSSTSTGDR